MYRQTNGRCSSALCAAGLLMVAAYAAAAAPAAQRWVSAFGRTLQEYMQRQEVATPPARLDLGGRTYRYAATLSAQGRQVRVRISNELERSDLVIGDASIAIAGQPATLQRLTWGRYQKATVPAGAPLISDPVSLAVEPLQRVIVSLYFPGPYAPQHQDSSTSSAGQWPLGQGRTNAQFSAPGNFVAEPDGAGTPTNVNPLVTGIEVLPDANWTSVIVYGASRAAGFESWPNKLMARAARQRIAISNPSTGATGMYRAPFLQNELARLDRDVLARPNVRYLVLQTGGDDVVWAGLSMENGDHIGGRLTPEPVGDFDLIVAGYRQLIARAHAHGIQVIATTLHPFKGATYDTNPMRQQRRDEVNTWMKSSGEFDGIIDFDALVHDADDHRSLRADYDSGNHITLNAKGNQAVADAIDLGLFKPRA